MSRSTKIVVRDGGDRRRESGLGLAHKIAEAGKASLRSVNSENGIHNAHRRLMVRAAQSVRSMIRLAS